jgi:iron complex transport system permease protein
MRKGTAALGVIALLGLSLFLSLRFGSVTLTNSEWLDALLGRGPDNLRDIVRDYRGPRAVMALLVGGGLAVSGAAFQALLRNPLAEPYILGVSGGAATAVVAALALGIAAVGSWLLPVLAFLGAIVAIVAVLTISTVGGTRMDVRVLLLAGVVIGVFFSACISLVLSLSDAATIQSAIIWIMGSVAGAEWNTVALVAGYSIPCVLVLIGMSRALNLLSLGEESAAYLGANVEQTKLVAYAVASLITAAGVAFTGVIGFVGLVVPHAVRLVVGADYRALLPLSFGLGGTFLLLSDLIARTVLRPTEIPIGVVTAFLGVPLFLILLRRSQTKHPGTM